MGLCLRARVRKEYSISISLPKYNPLVKRKIFSIAYAKHSGFENLLNGKCTDAKWPMYLVVIYFEGPCITRPLVIKLVSFTIFIGLQ